MGSSKNILIDNTADIDSAVLSEELINSVAHDTDDNLLYHVHKGSGVNTKYPIYSTYNAPPSGLSDPTFDATIYVKTLTSDIVIPDGGSVNVLNALSDADISKETSGALFSITTNGVSGENQLILPFRGDAEKFILRFNATIIQTGTDFYSTDIVNATTVTEVPLTRSYFSLKSTESNGAIRESIDFTTYDNTSDVYVDGVFFRVNNNSGQPFTFPSGSIIAIEASSILRQQ